MSEDAVRRYSRRPRRADAGFTLVEVSIILSVLVILSAMITPVVSSTLYETRRSAAYSELATLSQALREFLTDIGCEIVPRNDGSTWRRAAVQAPSEMPPTAPPTGSAQSSAGQQFIAAASSDPCSAGNLCDSEPIHLLVTAGDVPAMGPDGDDQWVRPVDGWDVDYVEFFLVANRPGNDEDRAFPSPDDCGVVGSLEGIRAWQGAYMNMGTGDPWGNRYMINTMYLASDSVEDVVVLSAGPDQEIDSEFGVDGFVPGDDDIALLFTKGY